MNRKKKRVDSHRPPGSTTVYADKALIERAKACFYIENGASEMPNRTQAVNKALEYYTSQFNLDGVAK